MMSKAPTEAILTRTERYQRLRNYYDRRQRCFLLFGAFVDVFFGSLLFLYPERSTSFFRLVVPPEGVGAVWVQLTGLLLITMALFYFYASLDPARHLGIVVIGGILGRFCGMAYYLFIVFLRGAPMMFLGFVGLDAVLILLHLWALGPDRWQRVKSSFACKDLYP